MTSPSAQAVELLNQAYIRHFPEEALRSINRLSISEVADFLQQQSTVDKIRIWNGLLVDNASRLLTLLPAAVVKTLIQEGEPSHTARILVRVEKDQRDDLLSQVDKFRQRELMTLVDYPADSAGALMDTRFLTLVSDYSVRDAFNKIKRFKPDFTQQLYTVDADGVLSGRIELHQLALANEQDELSTLIEPIHAVVETTATREEVIDQLENQKISDLPVVDINGKLVGVVRHDTLLDAFRQETSADLMTMVGANRNEQALSKISFVVRKRLPWLTINLFTAFLAAAVVGIFEGIIAKFTALAILLPVVAGQSGNTGAQALAVTMRGLALREIGESQWLRVARKEIGAAFINGCAIAAFTSLAVFFWSSSTGLAFVIGISMVIAMVAAAFAGVLIPITLSALGQDPAQSSSILLTTVTDVVGFSTFLGIATALSGIL